MTSTKYKIKDLVTVVDERNIIGIRNFFGINKNKEFMPTNAKTDGLDERKYKLVYKNRFVYSGMQTGRDECIRIGMYTGEYPIIVSPAYITFEITATDIVIPDYFFMIFLSKEKDRMGWFFSDSSIRANLDWEIFCDIEIELPPIHIQEKYVAVYKSMLDNQKAYETGLEDLKLVCDTELDVFKISCAVEPAKNLFNEIDKRNADSKLSEVLGININKEFMLSKATSEKLERYKVIEKNQFAYSSMQTGRDETIRIALYSKDNPALVSPAYSVLETNSLVLPEYVMMWFSRKEMDRYGWFLSDSSIRANLDLKRFFEIEIPIPPLQSQQCIVDIYNAYIKRKEINEKLKQQINDICPILIAGAIKEANANG